MDLDPPGYGQQQPTAALRDGRSGRDMDDAEELIALFARVSTEDKDTQVNTLAQILQIEEGVTRFFLEASNWNVETAIHAYLATAPSRENGGVSLTLTSTTPQATCVSDLSFLSTPFPAGMSLSMNWAFVNTGIETWPINSQLVLVNGENMSGLKSIRVPLAEPGEQVVIRQTIQVPALPGTHTGVWKLMSPHAGYFGEQLWIIVTTAAEDGGPLVTSSNSAEEAMRMMMLTPSVIQRGHDENDDMMEL